MNWEKKKNRMTKIKSENYILDTENLCYDLALAYAKAKFVNELRNGNEFRDELDVPTYLNEVDFLVNAFCDAYNELSSYDDDFFKEKLFIDDN